MTNFEPPLQRHLLRDFRENLWEEWSDWNKNMLVLRKCLLSIKGDEVLPHPDYYCLRQIREGYAVEPKTVTLNKMEECNCHQNALRLSIEDNSITDIMTGWALHYDDGVGLWCQHSWAMRDDELVETTVNRDTYYGISISEEEAKENIKSNGGPVR